MITLHTINVVYIHFLLRLGVKNPFLHQMSAYDWALYIREDINSRNP